MGTVIKPPVTARSVISGHLHCVNRPRQWWSGRHQRGATAALLSTLVVIILSYHVSIAPSRVGVERGSIGGASAAASSMAIPLSSAALYRPRCRLHVRSPWTSTT